MKMKEKNERDLLVAVDDGYAQTKLYGDSPDKKGGITKVIMLSSARAGTQSLGTISGIGRVGYYKTEEGEYFTVSDMIDSESTKFNGFHHSPMNRTLVHHVLASAGYGGKEVDLQCGLPVSDFFLDDVKDEKTIQKKEENLKRGIENVGASSPMAKIRSVKVGCQAVAAYVDYIFDDNMKERHDPGSTIAVVDIGGRTTDIAVVVSGRMIDHSRSGTADMGVLDVYETVARSLRKAYSTRDVFSRAAMDKAVKEKTIEMWGKKEDISSIVKDAANEHENKIAREVERKLGGASNLAAVVFVGGGAALFDGISTKFRNGVMAPNPEFANARGLYKYAKYQSLR